MGNFFNDIGEDKHFEVITRHGVCYSIAFFYLKPFGKPRAMISEDTEDAQTTSTDKEDSNSEPYSITSDMLLSRYLQEMKDQSATEDKLVLLKGVSGAFRPGSHASCGAWTIKISLSFPGLNGLLTEQLKRLTIAVELTPLSFS
ncbi:hypothetical protein H5410_022658 [Solanum commersonii]|uniref:Uncharacterized protein n=1 Tax=Solanum commersonii TaxID=4109 RepID=A0A9J5ZEQ7_SOLCO|nr:hypothetical protein H5410_022658 [Solanum commersonii]